MKNTLFIFQAAYDVAKAAKELLVTVHAREEQQQKP